MIVNVNIRKMSSSNFIRERDMAAKVCIHMEGKKTTISNPAVSEILYFSSVYVGCLLLVAVAAIRC